jgi:hypothetical protein
MEKEIMEKDSMMYGYKIKQYEIANVPQMAQMAVILKAHIINQKLYTEIAGKNYAHVEGWQFAGGLIGLFPRVVKVENISPETGGEKKWLAEVEIVEKKTGNVVSRGFGICSNKEMKRSMNDEYAILSMAQTRAIGKAYRNVIGWVMKLAGYEATPKEEMESVGSMPKTPAQEKKDSYEKILSIVAKTDDPERLKEIVDKLGKSSLLTDEQKSQIIRLINAKIASEN